MGESSGDIAPDDGRSVTANNRLKGGSKGKKKPETNPATQAQHVAAGVPRPSCLVFRSYRTSKPPDFHVLKVK